MRRALFVFAVALLSSTGQAQAGEFDLGLQALFGNEGHVEPGNNARVNYPVPFGVADVTFAHVEISGELVPLPSIPISSAPTGIHSITLSYFDGSVRYWLPGDRWALGIGETLWNQQTEYLGAPHQYDASRGAGARYEIANRIPLGSGNAIESILATSPAIHAELSYAYNEPGYVTAPVPEREAQVDAQVAFVRATGHWRIKFGARYMNMTATFPDGSFADANHVAGLFATALYALHF